MTLLTMNLSVYDWDAYHSIVEGHFDGEGASDVLDLDGKLQHGGQVVLQVDVVVLVPGQPGKVPTAGGHLVPGGVDPP